MTDNLPERAEGVAVALDGPISDLDQAWRLATALAQSDLVPRALRNRPANILLVIMTGQEIGLSVAQSLRSVFVPSNGQPQLRGQLILAKLREAGHDYEYDLTDDGCEFRVIRGDNGKPYAASFTVEDAKAAGLVQERDGKLVARSQDNRALPWELYRQDMLFWRAVSRAVNRAAPEVMMGFAIMGTVDPEPEPEVVLQPASKVAAPVAERHPQPAAQPAQSAEPAAEVVSELQELASQAAPQPAPAPPAEEEPDPGKARKPQLEQLVAKFTTLGWAPKKYQAQVLDACSAWSQREIRSAADLSQNEAAGLAAALSNLIRRNEPDHYPVALADAVEGWREGAAG